MSTLSKFEINKQLLIKNIDKNLPLAVSFFEIGKIISKPVLLKQGIANINYLVTTNTGSYVIKILLTEDSEDLANEIEIQKQLSDVGILCPCYIQNSDGFYLFKENNTEMVVSKLLPGTTVKKISNEFCFNMGVLLAKFHRSVLKLNHTHKGWLNRNSLNADSKSFQLDKNSTITSLSELKKRGESVIYNSSLPTGIIHGDLYEGNVLIGLVNPNVITAIFDFEHSENNILLVDLARTILSIAENTTGKKLESHLLNSTVEGYTSIRRLEVSEIRHLSDAIKYVAGIGGLWLVLHGEMKLAEKYLHKARSI